MDDIIVYIQNPEIGYRQMLFYQQQEWTGNKMKPLLSVNGVTVSHFFPRT